MLPTREKKKADGAVSDGKKQRRPTGVKQAVARGRAAKSVGGRRQPKKTDDN